MPARRSSRPPVRPLAGLEPLEGRALLSSLASTSTGQVITIDVPSAYVSDQARSINVTLRRAVSAASPGAAAAAQAQALLAQPLTVELSLSTLQVTSSTTPISTTGAPTPQAAAAASQQSASGSLPNSDGPASTQQSVTFPAGTATETVSVPLTYSSGPAGNAVIELSVQADGSQAAGMSQQLVVLGDAGAIPPSIIDAHVIQAGRKITAISLTFSKAMDPASVQDVHSYSLVPDSGGRSRPISFKSAVYDPSTHTVILTPRSPVKARADYQLGSGRSVAMNSNPNKPGPLLDLQGNVLFQTSEGSGIPGAFSITVGAGHPFSAPAPVLWGGN